MLTSLGERRLLHWGVSLVGPNRFCSPTTDLLIIIIIFIFIIILILSILIIPIILIIFIILIILFVLMIVVINSLLLPSLSSSSVSFIVLVSNLINIKRLALFVTCSNSKKPRETVAAFRLHLANPPLRLPPYPSPASFRTSPWPQVLLSHGRSLNTARKCIYLQFTSTMVSPHSEMGAA